MAHNTYPLARGLLNQYGKFQEEYIALEKKIVEEVDEWYRYGKQMEALQKQLIEVFNGVSKSIFETQSMLLTLEKRNTPYPRDADMDQRIKKMLVSFNTQTDNRNAFYYFVMQCVPDFKTSVHYGEAEQMFAQLCGVILGLAKKKAAWADVKMIPVAQRRDVTAAVFITHECVKIFPKTMDAIKNIMANADNIAQQSKTLQSQLPARLASIFPPAYFSYYKSLRLFSAPFDDMLHHGYFCVSLLPCAGMGGKKAEEIVNNWFQEQAAGGQLPAKNYIPVVSDAEKYIPYLLAEARAHPQYVNALIFQHLCHTAVGMMKIQTVHAGAECFPEPLWDTARKYDMLAFTERPDADFWHEQVQNVLEQGHTPFGRLELMVLYGFPQAYSREELALINRLIEEGPKCGLYTMLVGRDAGTATVEGAETLVDSIRAHCLPFCENFIIQRFDETAAERWFAQYTALYRKRHLDGVHTLNGAEGEDDVPACEPGTVPEGNAFLAAVCVGKERFQSGGRGGRTVLIEQTMRLDREKSHMLIECSDEDIELGQQYLHNVIWGFLSAVPVSKLNISVFDGKRRGASVAPFLDMSKQMPELFDSKIHSDPDDIYAALSRVNSSISERIQGRLGNRYDNMIAYNNDHSERSEPLQLLVINDFPAGFDDERTRKLLIEIMTNGAKCGIYVFLTYNRDVKPAYSYDSMDTCIEQLKQTAAICLATKDGRLILSEDDRTQVETTPAVSGKQAERFAVQYMDRARKVQRQGIGFDRILDEKLFSSSSAYSLDIPIGIGDDGNAVNVSFGTGSSHHALVAGGTGSGKSTLLHTLIISGMLRYSPEELNLFLLDFKNGTEFKVYESARLPHIKLLALEAMQEFGESILEELVTEMARRAEAFKQQGVSSLKDYVEQTGGVMPRILIIMDEFQILFNGNENSKIASHCGELAKRIVTEGRSYGVHLLMATQSTHIIRELSIAQGTIDQMFIRIGMKCVEDDANYLFTNEKGAKALDMMKGPIGTAVMTEQYVEAAPVGLRIAYCDSETQKALLAKIANQFSNSETSTKIFEAGRTTKLMDVLSNGAPQESGPVQVEIGELIKVAPPLKISFSKKGIHNILICSAGSKDALAMTANLFHLLAFSILRSSSSAVYCIDGDILLDEGAAWEWDIYEQYRRCPGEFHLAQTEADVISYVKEIYEQFQSRKRSKSDSSIFLLIRGLEEIDLIKQMMKNEDINESEYLDLMEETDADEGPERTEDIFDFGLSGGGFSSAAEGGQNVSGQLLKLINEGTKYGIHVIVTCSEYQCVREHMFYGENILNRFPERFVFSLNEDDAQELIDGVSVQSLKANMVYYSDHVSVNCQVKPYVFPSVEELRRYLDG